MAFEKSEAVNKRSVYKSSHADNNCSIQALPVS